MPLATSHFRSALVGPTRINQFTLGGNISLQECIRITIRQISIGTGRKSVSVPASSSLNWPRSKSLMTKPHLSPYEWLYLPHITNQLFRSHLQSLSLVWTLKLEINRWNSFSQTSFSSQFFPISLFFIYIHLMYF